MDPARPRFDYRDLALVCHAAQQDMIAAAVLRGCLYYSPLIQSEVEPKKLAGVASEVLACALLRGPMPRSYDAFRCGAMLLSDPLNEPDSLVQAAERLMVSERLGHIARLGFIHDYGGSGFWFEILRRCPGAIVLPELPDVTQLSVDSVSWTSDRRRLVRRIWLRPVPTWPGEEGLEEVDEFGGEEDDE